jgi:hypothetical protein
MSPAAMLPAAAAAAAAVTATTLAVHAGRKMQFSKLLAAWNVKH